MRNYLTYLSSIDTQNPGLTNFISFDPLFPKEENTAAQINVSQSSKDYFVIEGSNEKLRETYIDKVVDINGSKLKYKFNVHCKDNIRNLNNKKEISKKFIKKSKLNKDDINRIANTNPNVISLINTNMFMSVLEKDDPELKSYLDKNYIGILNKLCKNYIDENDIEESYSNHIFDSSSFYYRWFINRATESVTQLLKAKKINVNYRVLQNVLENALVYNSTDTFGVIYQTIYYMADQLGLSRNVVKQSLRKLEYVGILEGVVSDIKRKKKDMDDYVDNSSSIESTKIKETIKRNSEGNYFSGSTIFPLLNFDVLLDYIPDFVIEELFRSSAYELKYQASNKILKNLVDDIYTNGINRTAIKECLLEDDIIKKFMEPKVEQKKNMGDYNVPVNLFREFETRFTPYIENYSFNERFQINRFEAGKFFSDKTGELTINNVMDEFYIMSKWVGDNFKKFYRKETGKSVKKLDKKRINSFIDKHQDAFVSFEDDIFESDRFSMMYNEDLDENIGESYDGNMISLLSHVIESHRLGIVEAIKQATKAKFNSFKFFKSKKIRDYIELHKNTQINVSNFYYLKKIFSKYKKTSRFLVYNIIREEYKKLTDTKKKKDFMFKLYETFVRVNKNPNYICWNIINFIEGSDAEKI